MRAALEPYLLYLKVVGLIGVFLAGMWLMHTMDVASHVREVEAAKAAQDRAIVQAIAQQKADAAQALQAADELRRQQVAAADARAQLAEDAAKHKKAYSCALSPEGFQAVQEAFK